MQRLALARTLVLLVLAATTALAPGDEVPGLFIEGYPAQISSKPGDTLAFHCSTSAPRFSAEITRIGARPSIVWTRNDIPGTAHPVPENASSHGCQWPPSFEFRIPEEWSSGYYEVRLRATDNGGRFTQRNRRTAETTAFFIVRSAHPGRDTPILLQLATNTYNAYNNWGGSSLYGYHGRAGLQGHQVSFQRPLEGLFNRWERAFVVWAESAGYRIDYAANLDLEAIPDLASHYRLVLSVGHDEYWSAPMRDSLEAFIHNGGNAAFFSGNSVCWQVRWNPDLDALTCWKQNYHLDPVYPHPDRQHLLSTLWSHHRVGRPENRLTGVGFLHGGYHRSHGQLMNGSGAFTIHRPSHWLFEGTGLEQGDSFGGPDTVVGYECDGCEMVWVDGLPQPTGNDGTPSDFVILATAPARWAPDDAFWYEQWPGPDHSGHAVVGTYSRGGTVVTVGTTDWAHGLAGNDPAVVRITRNILDRLSR